MKTRLFTVCILAIGLSLFLTWAVAAQGIEIHPTVHAKPNSRVVKQIVRQVEPDLRYTADITFTPAFTVFLPTIANNWPGLCSSAPTLLSPTSGSVLTTIIPTLTFIQGGVPISQSVLEFSTNPDASGGAMYYLGVGDTLEPSQLQPFYNLQPATVYYWRVHDTCDGVASPYSSVFSFTTGSGGVVLAAPNQTSPISGTVLSGRQVTLTWGTVSGAVAYRVGIQQVGTPYVTLIDVIGTPYNVSWAIHQSNAAYEWWVLARNDYAYGADSTHWRFTTGPSLLLLSQTESPSMAYDYGYQIRRMQP